VCALPACACAERAGSVHPYRRRATPEQFPALGPGVQRIVFHRRLLARFQCRGVGRRSAVVCDTRTQIRAYSDSRRQQLGHRVLITRVVTAVVLLPLAVGVIMYLPTEVVTAIFVVLITIGDWEWSHLLGWRRQLERSDYTLIFIINAL